MTPWRTMNRRRRTQPARAAARRRAARHARVDRIIDRMLEHINSPAVMMEYMSRTQPRFLPASRFNGNWRAGQVFRIAVDPQFLSGMLETDTVANPDGSFTHKMRFKTLEGVPNG